MTDALIMAGGRSERMRTSGGPLHKALVPVLGVPMIERNLCALLSEGFHRIVVAISASEQAVAEYVEGRGRALANARQAELEILWERQPLGTIGAAREAIGGADTLLVVNVDNMTSLGLREFVAFHRQSGAALSVAAHRESFRVPFGELKLGDSRVRQYVEKPARRLWISSGTYVLGREACLSVPAGRRMDAPQLVSALLEAGKQVAAFRHAAAWIDVNQASSIGRAEQLIADHYQEFEWWRQPFDCQVGGLVLQSPGGILVEHRDGTAPEYPYLWHLPGERLEALDRTPVDALVRSMRGRVRASALDFLTSCDDLDTFSRKLVRHHIYHAELGEAWRGLDLDRNLQWRPLEAIPELVPQSRVLSRAMAALTRHRCADVLAFSR
ncbi:MAG: hypothetical protein DMG07_11990 [Acidobacteria bacterium]|nr:MAG: hypothetical protein DMG07_11990 [Acidobacteriota bacterium]